MPAGQLTTNTELILLSTFALLTVASFPLFMLRNFIPAGDLEELRLRIRSWWVMLCVFAAAIAFSKVISLMFFALLSVLALREYLALISTRIGDPPMVYLLYLAIPVQYLLIAIGSYELFLVFAPLIVLLLLATGGVFVRTPNGYLVRVSTMSWGLMLMVFALGHTGLLLLLPDTFNPVGGAAGLVLYLVLLTELNDIAQHAVGKLFGRHRLIPRISPKKTVEGLSGGIVITATVGCWLAPYLTPLSLIEGIVAGLLIALGGFLGDATISALKRDIGVKDTGTLLPGHGGILDRVDSLVVTAPLFFHYVYQLHHIEM